MYEESVDMSAASIAATSRPMSPTGRKPERKIGIATWLGSLDRPAGIAASASGASVASAAIPHRPGSTNRQAKKKLVRT
jgi:hypothetical protein